jgi:hypothetical protein
LGQQLCLVGFNFLFLGPPIGLRFCLIGVHFSLHGLQEL